MIYYKLNENKEVVDISYTQKTNEYIPFDGEKLNTKPGYNFALFLVSYMQTDEYRAKASKYYFEKNINGLRRRREEECFPIVNRGEAWYRLLLEWQRQELYTWYHQWLDVTETHVVPQKPDWLN